MEQICCYNQSVDVMNELRAVSVSLSSHNVQEDGNNDVIGDILGVLDDGISDQKEGSDVLETVGSKEESNSGGFNRVSQNGFGFKVSLAFLIDVLGFFNQSTEFILGLLVVLVLLQFSDLGFDFRGNEIQSFGSTLVLVDHVLGFVKCHGEGRDHDGEKNGDGELVHEFQVLFKKLIQINK